MTLQELLVEKASIVLMATLEEFRAMINDLDKDLLAELCEQFVYDHQGAIKATIKFAADFGISVEANCVKEFITKMHKGGEFDHVECWGLDLGSNDLYKKYHP